VKLEIEYVRKEGSENICCKSIHDAGQVGGNKNGIVMKGFSKKTSTKLERTASGL